MSQMLMIEDNEEDIELARRAFEKAGVQGRVRIARSGEEALEYLFSPETKSLGPLPRLILLDLNLPKKPGLEVLKEIRLNPSTRDIPIVVMTVSRQEPDLLQSFTMGAADYLVKPVDPVRFRALYQKYVEDPPQ